MVADKFTGAAWLVINKIRFCLGSTRTIFFPAATHSFAHRGPVAVYSPEEARPRAHVSSASQPCRTVVSGRSAIANSTTIPRKTTRQKDLLIRNSKVPTNLCPFHRAIKCKVAMGNHCVQT